MVKIFLDDERYPPTDSNDYIICRSVEEAINVVATTTTASNPLTFISFDNDLGYNMLEGKDFVKFLIDYDMDHDILSPGFEFYVHSQNPAARDYINNLLSSYIKFKNKS